MIRHGAAATLLFVLVFAAGLGAGEPDETDPVLLAVDEIAREVEEIRGLEFKRTFARKLLTPDGIEKIVREMIEKEIPPEKLGAMNMLLARMGFLRRGQKLEDCYTEFLKAGAAGLYDPETKTLYVVEGYSLTGAKPIIFHELVHALEDQHYDLGERMRRYMDDSDRAAGVQGLVEGSANHMTGKYLRKHPALLQAMMADAQKKAGEQARMIERVPLAVVAAMAFYPYFNGPAFVYRTTEDDAARIADLYANMPASTEQVLHPEKYGESGDYPVVVHLPDLTKHAALGGEWAKVHEDSVGELQMGFLLNEFLGGAPAIKLIRVINRKQQIEFRGGTKEAVEGWDGDRVAAYRGPEGACAFLWASRWDSKEDAEQFLNAYREALPFKWNEMRIAPATARLEARGDRVLVVEGFPEESLDEIAAAAWQGATFEADPRDKADVKALKGEAGEK